MSQAVEVINHFQNNIFDRATLHESPAATIPSFLTQLCSVQNMILKVISLCFFICDVSLVHELYFTVKKQNLDTKKINLFN